MRWVVNRISRLMFGIWACSTTITPQTQGVDEKVRDSTTKEEDSLAHHPRGLYLHGGVGTYASRERREH